MIIAGLIGDAAIIVFVSSGSFEKTLSVISSLVIAFGVWIEEVGSEAAEAKEKADNDLEIAELNARAAEANRAAEEEKHARLKLEARLQPRSLNQEQWNLIQGLSGKLLSVNIGYETDAETRWFAGQIRDAFLSAGISVGMAPRGADVHSFGTLIFEPKGFDGAGARTVGPLVEIFKDAETFGAVAIVTFLPGDIQAPSDVPMIILGGRFVLTPSHLEKARSGKQPYSASS